MKKKHTQISDGKLCDKEVIRRIFDRMSDNGMTQRNLAKTVGIGESTLSSIKSGKRLLKIDELEKFAEALGCPLEYLLGTDADMQTMSNFLNRFSSGSLSKDYIDCDTVSPERILISQQGDDFLMLTMNRSLFAMIKQKTELDHLKATLQPDEYRNRLHEMRDNYIKQRQNDESVLCYLLSEAELCELVSRKVQYELALHSVCESSDHTDSAAPKTPPLKIRKI